MKVLALAADTGGCGFYRMRAPADEVKLLGVDVTVSDGVDANAVKHSNGMVDVVELYTDVDLIVIQRPLDNAMTGIIEQAKRQGIATIVEIDDDFSSVHSRNVSHQHMVGSEHTGAHWVEKACNVADHVTVSTPQLTKYARHGRHSILRNCVPQSIFKYQVQRTDDPVKIGWSGSVQTHPDDLQQTKGAVGEVLAKNGLQMYVVGDGASVATNLKLPETVPVYATGWVDISLYYEAVATYIDIGIVPLEISPFNQAKSALKGLEFAALGVPFVATPTREYERMEAYGIGKTAKTPGEWRKHLQRMIDRPAETERIAQEARDRMEAEFTYKVNAPQWIEAWEKAIDYRKTHSP